VLLLGWIYPGGLWILPILEYWIRHLILIWIMHIQIR
jgi:hypothetical protein